MTIFKYLKDCYVEEGVEESYVGLKGRTKTKGKKVIGKSFYWKKKTSLLFSAMSKAISR